MRVGLSDEAEFINRKIFDFYDKNLSSQTIVRLMEVFEKLYSPEIEENWLNHSTRLLLQLTARSPDFDRQDLDILSNKN